MSVSARGPLYAILVLTALVAVYEAVVFYNGQDVGPRFDTAWQTIMVLLAAMWVEADSRDRPNVYRPFELGLFVVLFVVPYLPYYLLKTRRAKGLIWLVGFIFILFLGYWVQWLVHVAS